MVQEMSAILKCSEAVDIQHCFKHPRWNCVTIFAPCANSPDLTIQLFTFVILNKIIPLLSSTDISHCMRLNTVIISTMWQVLQEASSEAESIKTVFCFRLSAKELIHMILNTLIEPHNKEFVINSNPVPVLISLLGCGALDVQKSACLLTWKLMMDATFRDKIATDDDFPIIEVLKILQDSADSELSLLAWCSLFCLGSTKETGCVCLCVCLHVQVCIEGRGGGNSDICLLARILANIDRYMTVVFLLLSYQLFELGVLLGV